MVEALRRADGPRPGCPGGGGGDGEVMVMHRLEQALACGDGDALVVARWKAGWWKAWPGGGSV